MKEVATNYIGKEVYVKIDRPIGSSHPKYPDHIYLVNYGYVPNTISGDGEELDCYILGEYKPLKEYTGTCIAVIHRLNDDDDKLVIVPNSKNYTDSEIRLLTDFQEKYYESTIIRNDKISLVTNSKILSPTIETPRLILRRYKECDIDMQYEILQDKRLQEYVKFPNLTKSEELDCIKSWIKEADTSKYEKWVIELKNSNIPIGNISVNGIDKRNNYCNVGYVIKYEYWGNGYASEALNAVSNYLLKQRKYYLVECSCNELNKASSKVMLKAGFKKDGYIENRRLNQNGTYSKVEYYSKGM